MIPGNTCVPSRRREPAGVGALRLGLVAGVAPVFVLTAIAGSAHAQGMAVARKVQTQILGRVVYDSNAARGSNPLAERRDVRQDDILYSPSVRVDIVLPLARQMVFLNGNVGYEFRQYNKQLERERIELQGGVGGSLGPCAATATVGYSRAQSDLADLSIEVTKNTEERITYGVQNQCGIGGGFSAFAGVTRGTSSNSAAAQSVIDATTDSFSGGLNYSNRAIGTVGLNATYSRTDYNGEEDAAPNPTGFRAEGFEAMSFGVNLSRPIGNRLAGTASLAYTTTQQKGTVRDEFKGLTGSGSLTYRASPRLSATLSYQRGATATIQQGTSYAVTQNIGLTAGYTLSSRIRTSLGARYYKRDFRGEDLAVVRNQITNEDGTSIFGSVSFSIGRDMSLTLDASRDARNTNLTEFDYTGYRVGLTATKTF